MSIKEVKETNSTTQCNELLAEGWKIIGKGVRRCPEDGDRFWFMLAREFHQPKPHRTPTASDLSKYGHAPSNGF